MTVRNLGPSASKLERQADRAADDAKASSHKEMVNEEKVKGSPKGEYLSPHKVHSSAERRAALGRKHAEELAEEARRHAHVDGETGAQQMQNVKEEKEQKRLEGINWDEKRKKKGRRDSDGEDTPEKEETEAEKQEKAARQLGFTDGTGKYFEDMPADRMGDLALTDPNEIKRQLGPSVRFAQHAMLLAEDKLKAGMPRENAIEFLAGLYLGVADRGYARKALKDFGPATGIVDIYPLELLQHLLANVPSFLPRVQMGKLFKAPPKEGWKTETGKPITLRYDENVKIRGFALKGGERPGYLFEPIDPPGTYELTFNQPGRFTVVISAIAKTGDVLLEEFAVDVAKSDREDLSNAQSMKRVKSGFLEEDLESAAPAESAEPKKKDNKSDLKINFPRYI